MSVRFQPVFDATRRAARYLKQTLQWPMYYSAAGERGTTEARGFERQRKFDGLQRWDFTPSSPPTAARAVPVLRSLLFRAQGSRPKPRRTPPPHLSAYSSACESSPPPARISAPPLGASRTPSPEASAVAWVLETPS
ncbi:hypothetical protein FB451DRAFT_1415569 [Mycena latifolia]|nr:hypothetical protein FB451DRAFT_1415569 [Mycena latifolia]